MNMQLRWDLYNAKQAEEKELKTIRPFRFSQKSTSNTVIHQANGSTGGA
jgi:plasmid maintenance system antidote protein VapI